MVGPWFTSHGDWSPSPTGLLLGAFCRPLFPALFCSHPRDVPFPVATSLHWPSPCVPSCIPCLYPTGPPATQWRGPTGSSSIRGPFRAPCTGCSYPVHLLSADLFPVLLGAVVRPLPHPFPVLFNSSHPASRVYTPPGRQQPIGAGPLDPHPSGDRFALLARVAPIPPASPGHILFSSSQPKMIQSGPSAILPMSRS